MLESLFSKVASPKACNFIKKRLQHKIFEIVKNPYFEEQLRMIAFAYRTYFFYLLGLTHVH